MTRALKYAPARTFRSAAASLTPRQAKKVVRKSCAHIFDRSASTRLSNRADSDGRARLAGGAAVGVLGLRPRFLSLEKELLTFSSCVDVSDVVSLILHYYGPCVTPPPRAGGLGGVGNAWEAAAKKTKQKKLREDF